MRTGSYLKFLTHDTNIITNSLIEKNNNGGVDVSDNTNLTYHTESIIRQNTAKNGAGVSM